MLDEWTVALILRLRQGLGVLGTQLPRIVADPRSYPREAMLLAIMAVLLVLMLLFTGYAVYDTLRSRRTRRRMGLKVRRKARLSLWATAVTIAGAVVLLLALAPLIPSVGRACGVCHAVQDAVTTWQAGRHASVSCYGCHAAPGMAGAVSASLAGAGNVPGVLGSGSAHGSIHDAGCLSCHGEVRSGTLGGGVRMRHSDVIDVGMPCITCHHRVAHAGPSEDPGPSAPALQRPRMSICLTCHDGVQARSSCRVCHAGRPLDPASAEVAGITDLRVHCEGCHKQETVRRCIACHGLELPHPEEFLRRHAGMSADNPRLCARCHEGASTTLACECHTEPNVHGTYSAWFPAHGPAVQASGPGGCNCHRPSFCGKCHETLSF